MRRKKLVGWIAIVTTFLFAGCSGSVEIGPVPTITPKPTVTPAPTPTPYILEVEVVEENVYETRKFKEYYEKGNELPQLDVAYEDFFVVGMEVLPVDVESPERRKLIEEQFITISCKECLSPNYLMNYEASAASGDLTRISLDFSQADKVLKFAKENNMPVRGPELITDETPDWAFTKDFSEDQVTQTLDSTGKTTTSVEFASVDVITARMENYIKDVMTYCNTNYPGLIISWEIVDSVMKPDEKHEKGLKITSKWHQALGDDYIVKACEFGRKYAESPQKLLYTQDLFHEASMQNASPQLMKELKDLGLIDAVGIHMIDSIDGANVFVLEDMIKKVAAVGIEMHITEFHVDSKTGNVREDTLTKEEYLAKCARRYKNVMNFFCNMEEQKKCDIVSLTFEGLTDETSYLNKPREYLDPVTAEMVVGVQTESYPYMFFEDLTVKDNFFAVLRDVSVK